VRRSAYILILLAVLGLFGTSWAGAPEGASPSPTATPDPASPAAISAPATMDNLLNLMVSKGVLTKAEGVQLRGLPSGQQVTPLLSILAKKGVLTQEELAALSSPTPAALVESGSLQAATPPAQTAQAPPKPAGPAVVAAVAPIRVLPIDSPKREGLIPDLKLGPVRVKPYGFVKMSVVHDSSVPRGDDFPLPFFLYGDTGPSGSPEFHVKARAARIGSNFEWVDVSPKLTITGKLEMDFEGNYTATDNRNISSIRSSQMSIRLAYGRLDYAATDKTTVFGVFGQDWTPFGSTTLPNSLETTGLGFGFGSLYERAPQARAGIVHNFGGSRSVKFFTDFAAVLPAFGNTPSGTTFQIPGTNPGNNVLNVIGPGGTVVGTVTIPQTSNTGLGLATQLAIGERQGADSGRPEVEGRAVLQFQLDKAPGVAPAQLIVSGVQAMRRAIVISSNVPTAYKAAFPTGVETESERYGLSLQAQLPTRFATLLASWYRGGDLRFFFGGQFFSHYNATAGLTSTASAVTIDGSDTVVFGQASGVPTFAPQKPVRAVGGFVEVGLPLSRWFNVKPSSRMSGWTANIHYGTDQAVANDLYSFTSSTRARSYWYFGNIMYKLNSWVTLGFEQDAFRTVAIPNAAGVYPLYKGVPTREATDYRSEFATIFTF
jgi:hypothetical protein